METKIAEATLRDGRRVDILCIRPPAPDWRPRIAAFLAHKGQPWLWHVEINLDGQNDRLEQRFYVAVDGDTIISHMMVVERLGVAVLGHVFTHPAWRNQGTTSRMMQAMTQDFASRDGIVMFLHTTVGSQAYRIYARFGFEPVAPASDVMMWLRHPRRLAEMFDSSPVHVEPACWSHWPLVFSLVAQPDGDLLRNASLGLVGQCSAEDGFVMLMSQLRSGPPQSGRVLVNQTGMVMGLATLLNWRQPPSRLTQFDLYVHPGAEAGLDMLARSIELPDDRAIVACVDSDSFARRRVLTNLGFREAWCAKRVLTANDRDVDMILLER